MPLIGLVRTTKGAGDLTNLLSTQSKTTLKEVGRQGHGRAGNRTNPVTFYGQ